MSSGSSERYSPVAALTMGLSNGTSSSAQLDKKCRFLIECSSSLRSKFLIAARKFACTIFFFDKTRMFKRAKVLSIEHVEDLLLPQPRHPIRNEVLVLLSVKAGLRAAEIANLTWPMVVGPTGEIGSSLELHHRIVKKRSGRVVPIHPDLHSALVKLADLQRALNGPVIRSERGGPMQPSQYRLLVC